MRLTGSSWRSSSPICTSRAMQSQVPKIIPVKLSGISKEGDSTTSLGKMCQYLVTSSKLKTCFLMFSKKVVCLSLCLSLLVMSLGTARKSLAPSSLHTPCRHLYTFVLFSAQWPSLSMTERKPVTVFNPHLVLFYKS